MDNDPVITNLENTVYEILEENFTYLPEYSLQYISYFKPASLDEFGQAMSQTIFDYGIFGSFTENEDGTLELAFFSLKKGDAAPRELTSTTMDSVMDIFALVDQISLLLTESLTGRALRFASLQLDYPESVEAAKVFVDGIEQPRQQALKILTGQHNIKVALLIEDEYKIFRNTDLLLEESQTYLITISEAEFMTVQENPETSVVLGEEEEEMPEPVAVSEAAAMSDAEQDGISAAKQDFSNGALYFLGGMVGNLVLFGGTAATGHNLFWGKGGEYAVPVILGTSSTIVLTMVSPSLLGTFDPSIPFSYLYDKNQAYTIEFSEAYTQKTIQQRKKWYRAGSFTTIAVCTLAGLFVVGQRGP